MTNAKQLEPDNARVLSIDFFRGFTMFMLIGEFSGLFGPLNSRVFNGTIISFIGEQLHHHQWNGLHFWDLIQPFFMFIVGVSMPYAFSKRQARGDSGRSMFTHALKRSLLLLFFGWALYCIGSGKITFQFWNVLAQLSFTYLFAYLIMRKSVRTQLLFTLGLLVVTELLYRFFPLEGFNQPFVGGKNFGSWFDLLISGEISGGHWVAFNAFPTAAHTVWGVLAGILLKSDKSQKEKLKILLLAGLAGVIIGYSLNPLTPIIKRICTTSFVIVSGGWSLIGLAISYWVIDIKKYRKIFLFFAVVGMNPLFIYLFAHVGGNQLIRDIISPFTQALFEWTGRLNVNIITSLTVWALLWYICYFMYKKRVFIKI
jgi:predicted acyltransferase